MIFFSFEKHKALTLADHAIDSIQILSFQIGLIFSKMFVPVRNDHPSNTGTQGSIKAEWHEWGQTNSGIWSH